MNPLGMGPMEVLIVLLVAFIFLGPERLADAARLLGKAVREVRRLTAELPDLSLDEIEAPIVHRRGGPGVASPADSGPAATAPPASSEDAGEPDDQAGPVAFRPETGAKADEDSETTPEREKA